MKHVAQIQFEFCKLAVRSWDDMTIDEQWAYLRDHPGSKKRLTAKPRSYQEQADDIKQLDKDAEILSKINSRDLSRRAKTDLLSFQEKMRKEQNQMDGDDPRFDIYGDTLANISRALYLKGGKKNRHKPTGGP